MATTVGSRIVATATVATLSQRAMCGSVCLHYYHIAVCALLDREKMWMNKRTELEEALAIRTMPLGINNALFEKVFPITT